MWGPGPLGKDGSVPSEGGVVDLVDEDAEEGGSLIARVGLELGLDIENECGSDGGEQTSLSPSSVCIYRGFTRTAHEDKSRVQILVVFLHELLVVLLGLLAVVLEEPGPVISSSGRQVYQSLAA